MLEFRTSFSSSTKSRIRIFTNMPPKAEQNPASPPSKLHSVSGCFGVITLCSFIVFAIILEAARFDSTALGTIAR